MMTSGGGSVYPPKVMTSFMNSPLSTLTYICISFKLNLQKNCSETVPQLSRLQGSLNDSGPSNDPPTSPRKTWSAPNKDPFGGELQVKVPRNAAQSRCHIYQIFKKKNIQDPFKRSHSTGRTSQSGYEPSFGIGGSQARGRRGRGNAQGFDQVHTMQ